MKSKGLLIGIVVLVVVAVVAVVVVKGKSNDNLNAGTNSNSSSSSSKSNDNSALSNAVATTSATLQNFAFSPAVIKVKVGDTVTWTNKDAVQHNVVAKTASADAPNGPLFGQNQTYQFTFNKAGTYTLYCTVHPYMHQVVQVTQ